MSKPPAKTNACRLLDQLGVAYTMHPYEVDPEDLSAATVARKVGLPLEQVWKTLVCKGERTGVVLVLLPGDSSLDTKALAAHRGDKKVEPVGLKEVEPLTGYIRGGVTAFGGKKAYPVVVDETFELHPLVSVSAGVRGLQLFMTPADYLRATGATIAAIAK